jgi:hypothetical protein
LRNGKEKKIRKWSFWSFNQWNDLIFKIIILWVLVVFADPSHVIFSCKLARRNYRG